MPKWIHDRAEHLLAKNPSMPKSMAFAVATQQSHALNKSPKGYGTAEGRATAKAKFDTPKDDKKTANPGNLESPKMAEDTHKLQGHLSFQGIAIAIENRKGSVRKGVDSDGSPWRTVMKAPYGYIKGTKGADGDEVDVYIGPHRDAPNAYVVHQHKVDGTGFDEDKVILGVNSEEEAKALYLKHYDDPKFLGPISEVPIEKLKALIEKGKPMKKISSIDAFTAALNKIGATRAVKEWRNATNLGDTAGASTIARGYGQLGLSPRYLKDISSGGAEGGVDLMMGRAGAAGGPAPNGSGLVARKLYKSDSPIAVGENMGSLLAHKQRIVDTARGLSPEARSMVPAMYGHRTIVGPSGQMRHVSEHEFVPNAGRLRATADPVAATQRFQDVVAKPLAERGMPIADVPRVHDGGLGGNTGNVVMRGNTPKMIDFMPEHHEGPSGSLLTVQRGKHDIVATTAGSNLPDTRFTPGAIGRRGTTVMGAPATPPVTPQSESQVMNALRKDVFRPSAMSHIPQIPKVKPIAPIKALGSAGSSIRSMVTGVAKKLAFQANEFSGPMGPVIFSQASQIPAFKSPSLRVPVEKPTAKIAKLFKEAIAGFTPAGRLAATKRVGTGFGRAAPGPSIAEISKVPGVGKPLPGAVKDTI